MPNLVEVGVGPNGLGIYTAVLDSNQGIVVLDVDDDAPASRLLQRGDIIVSIEGEDVEALHQADVEELLRRYEQHASVTVVVDGFVPESMLTPLMEDRTAFAGDEVEGLARIQGATARERDMGAVPSSAKARKLNPIIVALKFPFAIVGMLVLFVLAIPEGFLRVVRYQAHRIWMSPKVVDPFVAENACFDVMMGLWYIWLTDHPTQGVVRRKPNRAGELHQQNLHLR